jgi:hypothetical protein
MIKEIIWNTSFDEVFEKVKYYKNNKSTPTGISPIKYSEIQSDIKTFIETKLNTKIKNEFIYVTGHQPEIFHPGILFKDLILNKLSLMHNAFPLHINVDTDIFEFKYIYPQIDDNNLNISKFEYHQDKLFMFEEFNLGKETELLKILNDQELILKDILNESVYKFAFEYINKIKNLIYSKEKFHNISNIIRNNFLINNNMNIPTIKLSEFIQLDSFSYFVEIISNRNPEFIERHNNSLKKYRELHKIKNHAQPIPDMIENELPFWELNNENGNRIHAKTPFNLNTTYSPRAITNTMFIRLFLSDLFIHGRGGARYEAISDSIIENFFGSKSSPYFIASATLYLENNNKFKTLNISLNELNVIIRDLNYSPEKFIESSDFLKIEKMKLQERFKDQNEDKKYLNQEIQKINIAIKDKIKDKIEYYNKIKENFNQYQSNIESLENREYPFFYYNMNELISEVDKISQLKNN